MKTVNMKMIDVGEKPITTREAEAEAVLRGNPDVLSDLWNGRLPKGEVQSAAEVAGILAAKRTPELLPMCHPIRLQSVQMHLTLEKDHIRVHAIACCEDRTGAEMEALSAASVAALTLYDWAKSHDPAMSFSVRLIRKSGGKSGEWKAEPEAQIPHADPAGALQEMHRSQTPHTHASEEKDMNIRAAVLTVSDRASQGIYEDKSGALLGKLLAKAGIEVLATALVPDELEQIQGELIRLVDNFQPDLVLTTGGTGFSPRDWTPEATRAVVEREVPGIPEMLRQHSAKGDLRTYLSRAAAGIRGKTLIVNLPGSARAVQEQWDTLTPILPHSIAMVRGIW